MGILTITKTHPCGKVETETIVTLEEKLPDVPKPKGGKSRKQVSKASATTSQN